MSDVCNLLPLELNNKSSSAIDLNGGKISLIQLIGKQCARQVKYDQ